jgi:L-asparaginase
MNKYLYLILLIIVSLIFICLPRKQNVLEALAPHHVPNKNRNILLIYTGGTIGMEETTSGYKPKKGYLEQQLKQILDLHPKYHSVISNYHVIEYNPLLDSSNMSPKDWNKMMNTILTNHSKYDAFVIVHGTDTMAYSASALSFGLENLSKPVIFTGSQIPLARVRNDGINNLLCSMILASNYNVPEVMLVFANEIIRGNRSKKISSNKLQAFTSPNYPNLGAFGYSQKVIFHKGNIDMPNSHGFFNVIPYNEDNKVSVMFLTPGVDFDSFKEMILSNYKIKGVILQTFGIGDGPTGNPDFIELLQFLKTRNITVVNVSQCIEGRVDQGDYATGSLLQKNNVISGQDMTLEAAYCKLLFLLSKYPKNNAMINSQIEKNLRGELSTKLLEGDVGTGYI